MAMAPVALTWGCASVHSDGSFSTTSAVQDLFATLRQLGTTQLDSAQLCGCYEALLGRAGVAAKTPGGWVRDTLAPSRLVADLDATLPKLCGGVVVASSRCGSSSLNEPHISFGTVTR
ncbi:hypothetical protein PG994_007957 [Apiospora phragmitis]|uniref:Uncharacterized protein n=1 Tax=Apiospora phragmitis TaxID=2905665 RepID=A0ABR1URP2_9PEZI